jgi:hypothetical protein
MNLKFSKQIFEKYSNTKFHDKLSAGSRDVAYEQTDALTERHDKIIVAFHHFNERA